MRSQTHDVNSERWPCGLCGALQNVISPTKDMIIAHFFDSSFLHSFLIFVQPSITKRVNISNEYHPNVKVSFDQWKMIIIQGQYAHRANCATFKVSSIKKKSLFTWTSGNSRGYTDFISKLRRSIQKVCNSIRKCCWLDGENCRLTEENTANYSKWFDKKFLAILSLSLLCQRDIKLASTFSSPENNSSEFHSHQNCERARRQKPISKISTD